MLRFFVLSILLMIPVTVFAQTAAPSDGVVSTPSVSVEGQANKKDSMVIDMRPALIAARQAAAAGDFEKAERLYRMILKAMPKFTEIRLEYAAAARRAGQARRAREILVPLDVDALPPGMRSAYRNIAWGERAFDISFSPRLMFDSNLNSGPSKDTVTIGGVDFSLSDENTPADSSGLGGTLAMQGVWMPSATMGMGATAIMDGDFYRNSDYNDINLSLSAGPRFIIKSALLRLNALGGTRFLGGHRLEDHYGGQSALTFNVAAATPLTLSAAMRQFEGDGRSGISRNRTHGTLAASIYSDRMLPWNGMLWLNAAYEREEWKRSVEDNDAYRGGFGFSLPKNDMVETHIMLNATRRLYDNAIPLLGVKRAEWRVEPSVRLDLKKLQTSFGVPYVQYTYIDNISNVVLTDYHQHKVTAGLVMGLW